MDDRWRSDAVPGDELDELVYLSNVIGADDTLTQPGGGNSSVKRHETDVMGRSIHVLRVKGSGTDLATIGRSGFSGLRLSDLAHIAGRDEMSDEHLASFLGTAMLDPHEPSPSIETPLHSLLPFRFIVHTHDFASQALTDTARPEENVREALGEDVAYIDYVHPGFPLARAVAQLGPMPKCARGLVLGRHGLVAWGDSAKSCYENLHRIVNRAEAFVDSRRNRGRCFESRPESNVSSEQRRRAAEALLPRLRARLSGTRRAVLHYDDSDEALAFAGDERATSLAAKGMSTPEHILRCGRVAHHVDTDLCDLEPAAAIRIVEDSLTRFATEYRELFDRHHPADEMLDPVPRVVLLRGLGLVTSGRSKTAATVANLSYRHVIRVMEAAEALGGFRFLDDAQAVEFEYWPLELVKLNLPQRELNGQVALVTGAASGIGRAISERLVAEQAHVVLTDVRADALRQTAAEIGAACKDPNRVRAFVADASRPEDAAAAVADAVLAFGGLDILVANAGYLEAGPLEGVSEEVWDRHFDVNVKGCFLAAREAVRVMKAQGNGGVILLNASKGAFAPTVSNAAYASSKAAVAALARNLATELAPDGIRVNYFNADFVDTPLMRSLIAQRAALKGITFEEQEQEYRARNLLGVGPIPPSAVAEAALFLVSARSRYTTGAVLPIDGGIKEAMPR